MPEPPCRRSLMDHVSALADPREGWRVMYPLRELLRLVLSAEAFAKPKGSPQPQIQAKTRLPHSRLSREPAAVVARVNLKRFPCALAS